MAAIRLLLAWAAALALAVVQANYLPGPFRGIQVVDFFLLISVYYGLQRGPAVGMTVGCLTGLLQDAASGYFLGFNGLSKTLAATLAAWLGGRLTAASPAPQALILVLATVAERIAQHGIGLLTGRGFGGIGILVLAVQCAANALAGTILFQMAGGPQRGLQRRA